MDLLLESPRATLHHPHRCSESSGELPEAAFFIAVSLTNGLSNVWAQVGSWWTTDTPALGVGVSLACFDAFNDKRSFKLSHGPRACGRYRGAGQVWPALANGVVRGPPPLKSCGFGRHLAERLTFPSENPAPLRILWEMDTSPTSPKPHMFAVEFERHPGDSGATAIVLADGPQAARLGRRPPGAKGRRAGRGQPL
jgi:hypothetical protein